MQDGRRPDEWHRHGSSSTENVRFYYKMHHWFVFFLKRTSEKHFLIPVVMSV